MTVTISASFPSGSAAKEAASILKNLGYRVALAHQHPAQPGLPGVCPGSGVLTHLENTVMVPDPESAVLTVLVDRKTREFALETIRRHGGKTIH